MSRPLTAVQREVLETLIRLYEKEKRMIKSKEVAMVLGKDEGTVRNIIMWLKSMGLVESRTGPAGGYVPTLKAYEVLGTSPYLVSMGHGRAIVKKGDKELIFTVGQLEIMGLFSIEPSKAVAKIVGSVASIEEGDKIIIESVPRRKLRLEGTVKKKDPNANEVLISIEKLVIIPDEIVERVATKKLITIKADTPLREAARILYSNGIRGAPVVDDNKRIIGFITTTDIAMVVANREDLDAPVSKYMRRNVFAIGINESIIEAMRLMDFHGVGRLVVIDNNGNPAGIITRTDILRFIIGLK